MFRSGGAPAPKKHPSYANRTQPLMQRVAAVSGFNGAATAPLTVEGSTVGAAEARPKSSARGGGNNAHYKKTDIFFTPGEDEDEDELPPEHFQQRAAPTGDFLGGQDAADRWTTTTQYAQAGQVPVEERKAKGRGVKLTTSSKATFLWGDGPPPETDYYKKHHAAKAAAAAEATGMGDDGPPEPEQLVRLKQALASRGAKGIVGLAKRFKLMDLDDSKSLDRKEFTKGLKTLGLRGLTPADISELFTMFDRGGDGYIDYEEFLATVRGHLNRRRRKLVNLVFATIDLDGNGYLDHEDFVKAYNTKFHPDVLGGKKTEKQVLRELIDVFDVGGGEKDGKVTVQEFENYYSAISASIDSDDYFELMIRNAWHISGGEGWCENTTCRRVLVTHADGRQTVEEIKNDIGIAKTDKKAMMGNLQGQGISATKIEFGYADKPDDKKKGGGVGMGNLRRPNSSGPVGSVRKPSFQGSGNQQQGLGQQGRSGGNVELVTDNEVVQAALEKMRSALAARGATGIIGIGRKFKMMDDDGNKSLDKFEFLKGVTELGIGLTKGEINALFVYFDREKSGSIDYEEFLAALRGGLNERRKVLVNMAFDIMDKDGNGYLDYNDVVDRYDAKKHPDVIAGGKTEQQVLTEFLATFDVGGEQDGKITRQEFQNYYGALSASIDDDDYFELMIRNAWHISGGEGWCANSSNRRVLVTHADGRQTVEEIKNDLGVKADDKKAMSKNLKSQGISAAKIELTYGDKPDEKKKKADGMNGLKLGGDFDDDDEDSPNKERQQAYRRAAPPHNGNANRPPQAPRQEQMQQQRGARASASPSVSVMSSRADDKPPRVPTSSLTQPTEIMTRAHELKVDGMKMYNACNYSGALELFTEAYDAMYKTFPRHVECGKLQKAMDSCAKHIAAGKIVEAENSESSTTGNPVLDKLREALRNKGARGIIGLSKKFRLIDDDHNGHLNQAEFRKLLKLSGLSLQTVEMLSLFAHFDRDGNGTISFDEFLTAITGVLNKRRKAMVKMAFDIMDQDGNGYLDYNDVIDRYNAKEHPEVIAKTKTEKQVLAEFLDTFDVGGEKDGKVTLQEFMNYYAAISASIDNDDYFELMIRNAWHISGGEGWCANTTNRRVLVTHADGRQTVEEIKNDIGMKADDKKAMVDNLKAQGMDAAKVELTYGDKPDEKKKGGSAGGSGRVSAEGSGASAYRVMGQAGGRPNTAGAVRGSKGRSY